MSRSPSSAWRSARPATAAPLQHRVQRGPHPRDHAGHRRVPRVAGHHRPAVHRRRHARAQRARRRPPRSTCSWPTRCACSPTSTTTTCRRPALSHAILKWNNDPRDARRGRGRRHRDHARATTRRSDGGFKYNPPHGGPADSDATSWIANRANELIADGCRDVNQAEPSGVETYDFRERTTSRTSRTSSTSTRSGESGIRIGADPLGGASVHYWARDPRPLRPRPHGGERARRPDLAFMTLDWDGKIRMDPVEPVGDGVGARARGTTYDILTGNDADADRHGIVTPDAGLMNPNHYLAVAIEYLFAHRTELAPRCRDRQDARVELDDRPGRRRRSAAASGRCRSGSSGSCQASSTARSASAARRAPARRSCASTARVWTTDKDGILLCLLASEIRAVTGKSPSQLYAELVERFGDPAYAAHGCRGDPRAEGRARQARRRRDRGDRARRASRSRRSCRTRRATTRRSAA